MKGSKPARASKVWLFDPQRLVLGDILLERGADASGKAIAAATGGRFSHALIWVGSDFVEAMPGGVRNLSFGRVPVTAPENWALLRPKPAHRAIAEAAAIQARHMVAENYDLAGAVLSPLGGRRAARSGSRFCSQLIAEAYQRAGLVLVPGKRPEQVTPNMLFRLTTHDNLVLPLIDATQANAGRPYPTELLDRSQAFQTAPMRREGEINRQLFKDVEDLVRKVPLPGSWTGARPASFNEVLDLLPFLPQAQGFPIADRLLESMEDTGYLHLLEPVLADLEQRVGAGHRDQISGWEQTRQRYLGNAVACSQRGQVMPHQIWNRLAEMYKANADAFERLITKASQ